jgi:hypothetical protein
VSLIEDERVANKPVNHFFVFSWRDLVAVRYKNAELLQVRSLVYKRILEGVQKFVDEHTPSLGVTVEECKIRSFNGSVVTFGVPFDFVDAFYSWFDHNLENRFCSFATQSSTNSSVSETKKGPSSSGSSVTKLKNISPTSESILSHKREAVSDIIADQPLKKKKKKKKRPEVTEPSPPVFDGCSDLASVLNVDSEAAPHATYQELPSNQLPPSLAMKVPLATSSDQQFLPQNLDELMSMDAPKKKMLRYNS